MDKITENYNYFKNMVASYSMSYAWERSVEDDVRQEVFAALASLEAGESAAGWKPYDPTNEKNADWLTYMHNVANTVIQRFINERQDTVAPLSRRLGEEWSRARRARAALEQTLGREPRNREVAEAMGITLEQYEALRSKADYEQVYLADLEFEDDDGEAMGYEEVLPGSEWEEPEYVVIQSEQREFTTVMERVHEQLALMDAERSDVIRRYFGIGMPAQTLREIENETDVPRMTVSRQLTRALEDLRARLTLMGVVFEDIQLS